MTEKRELFYYTQDGKRYVLKSITKNTPLSVVAAPTNISLTVNVNYTTVSALPYILDFKTEKRIIPVMGSLSFLGLGINPPEVVNINSIYYLSLKFIANSIVNYQQQNALLKLIPLATRIFDTSDSLYSYSVNYKDARFIDSDFIDCQTGMSFIYQRNFTSAFTGVNVGAITIPAGTYSVGIGFLYFELYDK